MKLYKAQWYDPADGCCISWHGSKRDAEKGLREARAQRDADYARDEIDASEIGPEGVEPVEIPTDKKGLMDWLNSNFSSDNG